MNVELMPELAADLFVLGLRAAPSLSDDRVAA
jgi:hypothetical protein